MSDPTESLNPMELGFFVFDDLKKSLEFETKIRTFRDWDFSKYDMFAGEPIIRMVPKDAFRHNVDYEPYMEAFDIGRNDYNKDEYIEDWFEEKRMQSMDMDIVLQTKTMDPAKWMERDFFNAVRNVAKWMPKNIGNVEKILAPSPSQSPFSEDPQNPRTQQVNWDSSSNCELELLEYNTGNVFSKEGEQYVLRYTWSVRVHMRLDDPYKMGENPDPQERE